MEKPGRKRKSLSETRLTGPMLDRVRPDGKRQLSLTTNERRSLKKREQIERAVSLFLDLENAHSWVEMAEELGLSVMGLKDLTKTEEFIEVYNRHFTELGHDPRLRAGQQAIVEMVPNAVIELRNMLASPSTPPTVKLNVIKEIFALAGIQHTDGKVSDKGELAEFLKQAGVQSIEFREKGIPIPSEFKEKMDQYSQIIDVDEVDHEKKKINED